MFLLLKSLDNLAAKQTHVLPEDSQIREAKIHCQYASHLVPRAVKPMQVAIASAEVAKAAAAASKVAANVALQAKAVATQAFSSCSLGPPPLSTKNRFDLLSSMDE